MNMRVRLQLSVSRDVAREEKKCRAPAAVSHSVHSVEGQEHTYGRPLRQE